MSMTLRLASEDAEGVETGDAIFVELFYKSTADQEEATREDFLLDVLSAAEALAMAWWDGQRPAGTEAH